MLTTGKQNILFLRCVFRPAHTQDRTCETTSLSAWRGEDSSPDKSQEIFPKHTGRWRGAEVSVRPGHSGTHGVSRGSFCPDAGGAEGGSKAQSRRWVTRSVPLLGAERPPQPHQRTGQQDCGAPRPVQPRSRCSTSAPPISREAGSQVFKWKIKTGENNQEASVNNN